MDGLGLNGNCKIHGMPPPPPPPGHTTPSRASSHPLLRSTELPDTDLDGDTEGEEGGAGGVGPEPRRRDRSGGCWINSPEVTKAVEGVRFIAEHTRREEESIRVRKMRDFRSNEGNKECGLNGVLSIEGERRLEICGNGVGSFILMDIYTSCPGRNGGYYSPGSDFV